ncbi:sugar ABC transporter substrate-binding protein [Nonomuraea sp. NPDC026600]|uniref:ABC transporter substrate-binding protein n=1 Tax=Nonomuraea sp. NPDC026600 TaxID=3155363 RepID=UPI003409AB3C
MSVVSSRNTAIIALAAVAALAGCSSGAGTSSGGAGKPVKIALFLPESKTARYEAKDRPLFTAKIKQLCGDCEVLYYNAEQDPAKQQQQVEQSITDGAQVLVLDPVDSTASAQLVTRAKQAKIPVIAYSRPILNADIDYFVSNDNYQVGVMQGQALISALKADGKTEGNIVMINGSPTDNNAAQFKRGAHSVLDTSGFTIAAEYDTPDWSPDKAQQQMDQAITKMGAGDIAGVYAANDGTAGGAIAAMKTAGMKALPPITGQDAELAAIQRVLAGEQYMTVYKPIQPQAEAAAELAVALANGKRPPANLVNAAFANGRKDVPTVNTPIKTVTQKDVLPTIIKDGFWSPQQICVDQYKVVCTQAEIR